MRQEPLSQEQVNELIALRLDDVLRCWLKSSQPLRSCVHLHRPSSRSTAVLALPRRSSQYVTESNTYLCLEVINMPLEDIMRSP